MTLLADIQAAAATFIAKVADLVTETGYLHDVVTGPAGGSGSLVNVGPRTLKTLARVELETLAARPFSVRGVYDAGTTYAALDAVFFVDTTYVSMIDGNLGNTPGSSPDDWMQLVVPLGSNAVTPFDFGAVGDGVADDTTAIQAAMDSGAAEIYVPGNIFACNQIAIPTSLRRLIGPGAFTAIGSLSAFSAWFRSAAADNFTIDGISFIADSSYDTNGILNLISANVCRVQNCVFNGGRFSVQIEGSSHTIVQGNEMLGFKQSAVSASGANDTLKVNGNVITNTGTDGHSIVIGDDTTANNDCDASHNSIFGGPTWGIHFADMARGQIAHNTVRETAAEAITVGGASFSTQVSGNTCYWVSAGTDVGISCAGRDSSNKCIGIVVDGNVVERSYKGGVLVDVFSEDCLVQTNRVLDCNRSNGSSAPSAINMNGSTSLRTTVINNYATNAGGGHMDFIARETSGAGAPNYSYVAANYGRLMSTGLVHLEGLGSVEAGNVALP